MQRSAKVINRHCGETRAAPALSWAWSFATSRTFSWTEELFDLVLRESQRRRQHVPSQKKRMRRESTRDSLRMARGRTGRGNWLTSGSPIRATIRHELHSHAHLHTRLYINIRGDRETGPALHTGPPARVISPFAGIAVGHCARARPEILRKESRPADTVAQGSVRCYVPMNWNEGNASLLVVGESWRANRFATRQIERELDVRARSRVYWVSRKYFLRFLSPV